jgi:acid phosphatase
MKFLHIFIFVCFSIQLTEAQTVPAYSHIVVVIGENTSMSSVFGNSDAPYINSLAANGAKFTNSYAITHPSQPNYLVLYSGDNQGVTDNNKPASKFTTPNLGYNLISSSKTYTTYSEGLPSVGSDIDVLGNYARKHNPAANWVGSGTNQIPPSTNQPFTAFPSEYNNLPTVSFVVPDLCNGGHNVCPPLNNSVKQFDSWVQTNLDAYKQWCINNNSLLIVTYDEDDNLGTNKIATVFYGANVAVGSYSQTINHFSILRTLEAANMLGPAGSSAASAINFCWTVVLPVNIVGFTGKKINDGVLLRWNLIERNLLQTQVYHSINGQEFNKIGSLLSTGSNTYSFLDTKPKSGSNFYKLEFIDEVGRAKVSNVIRVDYNDLVTLSILPNPVYNQFHINSTHVYSEAKLLSIDGAVLRTWKNVNYQSIFDIQDIKKGIYILKLISDVSVSLKVIKE